MSTRSDTRAITHSSLRSSLPPPSSQQFGNFQCHQLVQQAKKDRSNFGRFYFRSARREAGGEGGKGGGREREGGRWIATRMTKKRETSVESE